MEKETKDAIEQTKEVLAMERPCKACVFSNEACDWCIENKIPINRYMRGCRKFMTNEEAVRKVAEAEQERQRVAMTKMYFEMDIMGYLANAASLILEKIDKRIDASIEEPGITSSERENRSWGKMGFVWLATIYKQMVNFIKNPGFVDEDELRLYFDARSFDKARFLIEFCKDNSNTNDDYKDIEAEYSDSIGRMKKEKGCRGDILSLLERVSGI